MNNRMPRSVWLILALFVLGLGLWSQQGTPVPAMAAGVPAGASAPAPSLPRAPSAASGETAGQRAGTATLRYPAFLPQEAHAVLGRIAQGGPFEYRQDGGVFQNRERRLPPQPRGYYREYTVETPGSPDRGARRLITGGEPPHEYWYTDDHYRSFQRFEVSP